MESTIFQASVYIKHPGHFPIMREELCQAQQSSELTDMWLVAKDKVMIPVHRCLLPSVASLTQDVWCCEQPTVVLAQESSQTLVSLVTLLYNGMCSLQGTSLLEVIVALRTLGIFLPLAELQWIDKKKLVVGAEYYQRGRDQEEAATWDLAFDGQEHKLSVPVSTLDKDVKKEPLVNGQINAKQREVKHPKLCEDEEHGDEEYLEEVITGVVESEKRRRSMPKSTEKYQQENHTRPSSSHLPYVKTSLEPKHNIEDCLVPSCSDPCDLVEEEQQVWQRKRRGQLELRNVKFQAKQSIVKQPKVMLHKLDDTMINRMHLGGTCEPTKKNFQILSSNTRVALPFDSVQDQFEKTAFTGKRKLQVAVKQPVDLGDMEGEGISTGYSYIPQVTGQVVRSPSTREHPDRDGRSNGVKSYLEMSHVCPRWKGECLQKLKQINHNHSLFAASAVQCEDLAQQGIK